MAIVGAMTRQAQRERVRSFAAGSILVAAACLCPVAMGIELTGRVVDPSGQAIDKAIGEHAPNA